MTKKLSDKVVITRKGILRKNVGKNQPYIDIEGASLFNATSEIAKIALELGYSFGDKIDYNIIIEKN